MINSNTKMLIMIDHTHIFSTGVVWDEYQLKLHKDDSFKLSDLHPYNRENILNAIECNNDFFKQLNKFVKKVKHINSEYLEKIMADLPNDWNVTFNEKEELIDFITSRFKRIDEILELLKLKGGDNSEY